MDEREIVAVFKALADENRIRILRMLGAGEKCACRLLEELEISQPTLSHHMKVLCDTGIVTGRKEGKWMHYSICRDRAENVCLVLGELLSPDRRPANCGCEGQNSESLVKL